MSDWPDSLLENKDDEESLLYPRAERGAGYGRGWLTGPFPLLFTVEHPFSFAQVSYLRGDTYGVVYFGESFCCSHLVLVQQPEVL